MAGASNSTVTLQSGQPFQLNYNFEDDYSGSGNGFDRPDVVGPIVYNAHSLQLPGPELVCDPVHYHGHRRHAGLQARE